MLSSGFTTTGYAAAPGPPLLGALLRIPWEHIRARMLDGLHDRGYTDLIPAHMSVFQYPGPDGARPSELAARIRMSKQALGYLLRQLEHLGYLTRGDDPDDLRAKRIRLTGRGREVQHAIRQIVGEVECEWADALGADSFSQLRQLLRQLRAVVET